MASQLGCKRISSQFRVPGGQHLEDLTCPVWATFIASLCFAVLWGLFLILMLEKALVEGILEITHLPLTGQEIQSGAKINLGLIFAFIFFFFFSIVNMSALQRLWEKQFQIIDVNLHPNVSSVFICILLFLGKSSEDRWVRMLFLCISEITLNERVFLPRRRVRKQNHMVL